MKSVEYQADQNTVTNGGMDVRSLSSETHTESATETFLPNDAPINCQTSSDSHVQIKSEASSGVADDELKTNNSLSTSSSHKMNLDDYRRRRTKLAVTSKHHYNPANQKIHHVSKDQVRAELTAETNSSTLSSTDESGAKACLKLKIGSEVVVSMDFNPEKQSSDVCKSNEVQSAVGNGNVLPNHSCESVPKSCVNGDVFERLNVPNVSSHVESNWYSSSKSSSDEEDYEPPRKHARMSFKPEFSPVSENRCKWIHHD